MHIRIVTVAFLILASCTSVTASPQTGRASDCPSWAGTYVGTIQPSQSIVSAEPRRIEVRISGSVASINFGGKIDPLIVIEDMKVRCSPDYLQGSFEDNWGSTGQFKLKKNERYSDADFLDMAKGSGRNYVGFYPNTTVRLEKQK